MYYEIRRNAKTWATERPAFPEKPRNRPWALIRPGNRTAEKTPRVLYFAPAPADTMIMNNTPTLPAPPCPVDLLVSENPNHPTIRMPAARLEGLVHAEKLLANLKGTK